MVKLPTAQTVMSVRCGADAPPNPSALIFAPPPICIQLRPLTPPFLSSRLPPSARTCGPSFLKKLLHPTLLTEASPSGKGGGTGGRGVAGQGGMRNRTVGGAVLCGVCGTAGQVGGDASSGKRPPSSVMTPRVRKHFTLVHTKSSGNNRAIDTRLALLLAPIIIHAAS